MTIRICLGTHLAFVGAKVAVFVDGCFWHACPVHATWPKANAAWWREKILVNVSVAIRGGLFSGDHQWPDLGDH